jgi:hypothetical protein
MLAQVVAKKKQGEFSQIKRNHNHYCNHDRNHLPPLPEEPD